MVVVVVGWGWVTQSEANSTRSDVNRKWCNVTLFSRVHQPDSADARWPHLRELEGKKKNQCGTFNAKGNH